MKERNVLVITLDAGDGLHCADQPSTLAEIHQQAKRFIVNPANESGLPEKVLVDVPYMGIVPVTKNHVILLRCHREASYKAYIAVQNELVAVYNELRDELARQKWQCSYAALDEGQQQAIRMVYPQKIAEAELKEGGK